MDSLTQTIESYRYLIYYIIGISLLRGLVVPDFRYGYFSVIIIQIAYPILLLLPLFIEKVAYPGYWCYLFLGIVGIVLSTMMAVSRYVMEFGWNALDPVSNAILTLSFAAMAVLFAVTLAFVVYWKGL